MFIEKRISIRLVFAAAAMLLGFGLTTNMYAFGVEAAMAEKKARAEAEAATKEVVADSSNKVEEKLVVAEAKVSDSGSSGSPESQHIGNPDSIEAGRQKYGNTCLFCHGPKGVGARAPTLVDNGFAPGGVNDNNYFFTTIKYGKPGTIMGAFEGTLTETEMWQVIAYLRDQADKVAASK